MLYLVLYFLFHQLLMMLFKLIFILGFTPLIMHCFYHCKLIMPLFSLQVDFYIIKINLITQSNFFLYYFIFAFMNLFSMDFSMKSIICLNLKFIELQKYQFFLFSFLEIKKKESPINFNSLMYFIYLWKKIQKQFV